MKETSRVADAIDRRRETIVQRWLGRLREEMSLRRIDPSRLRDAIGVYLQRLAEALRRDTPGGLDVEQAAIAAWDDVASEHALTRIRLGFDVGQLVYELALLRRVIIETLWEHGELDAAETAELLTQLLDPAVASSIRNYVASRDLEMRRRQAEHVGFVTHELRNPLASATVATAELVRLGVPSDAHRRALALLERSHLRMAELIDRVLLSERLGAGRVEANMVDQRLGDVVGDVLAGYRHAAEQKRLAFVAHLDGELVVRADAKLAASVLGNLLDNAVKFTDRGTVEVRSEERRREVEVHVTDTCDGISEEELATIFEPYKRGHSGKQGAGLGLAIARRAIEAQGGTIHAESGDRGCHFWFTLPRPEQGVG